MCRSATSSRRRWPFTRRYRKSKCACFTAAPTRPPIARDADPTEVFGGSLWRRNQPRQPPSAPARILQKSRSRSCRSGHHSEYSVGGSDVASVIRLGCLGLSHHRNQQLTNETFGAPIEQGLPSELRLNAGDHASRSESSRLRLVNQGTAALFPRQLQEIPLHFPANGQAAGQRG